MGRIRQMIDVKNKESWTLFDTGSRNTYITTDVASKLATSKLSHAIRTGLGGETKQVHQTALLEANVEGHQISTHAMVVEKIGTDEEGKPIEILFGALAMQQWGIRLNPEEEKIDLSHYPEEFIEF